MIEIRRSGEHHSKLFQYPDNSPRLFRLRRNEQSTLPLNQKWRCQAVLLRLKLTGVSGTQNGCAKHQTLRRHAVSLVFSQFCVQFLVTVLNCLMHTDWCHFVSIMSKVVEECHDAVMPASSRMQKTAARLVYLYMQSVYVKGQCTIRLAVSSQIYESNQRQQYYPRSHFSVGMCLMCR